MGTVYVTGAGTVSSIGLNLSENIQSLKNGLSGLGKVRHFETSLDVPVGEVPQDNASLQKTLVPKRAVRMSRTSLLGIQASVEAVCDCLNRGARLSDKRIGLISGTSVGGMDLSEQFWRENRKDLTKGDLSLLSEHDCGASTQDIAEALLDSKLVGSFSFITTISTACSSAGNALMLAFRMIRSGMLDCAVVGGTDSLCRFTINGFNSLMILSGNACRPFDETRDGLNLGEGAGYLVLSSEEAENSYCRMTGAACADEAFHQTGSSPDGTGPYMAMEQALRSSGLKPGDISFINTHGTGTSANDLSESVALKRLFGEKVPPFGSVKAFIGHTLGASEGIEAAYCAYALSKGALLPSLNFKSPISQTGLVPCGKYSEGNDVRNILSNSFGFGGNCSSLVFSKI